MLKQSIEISFGNCFCAMAIVRGKFGIICSEGRMSWNWLSRYICLGLSLYRR